MRKGFKSLFNTIRNLVGTTVNNITGMISGAAKKSGMSVTETTGKSVDDFSREVAEEISKDVRKELTKEKKRLSQSRKKLARETQKMATQANMRLNQLKKQGLEKVSAYAAWERNGKILFSVRGKSYQELQKEYWRVKNFLDASTSTADGAIKNMQRIAKETMKLGKDRVAGMSVTELKNATTDFFTVSERVKQELEKAGRGAVSMQYQRIFNAIADYTRNNAVDMSQLTAERIENMATEIGELIISEKAIDDELLDW